MLEDLDHRLTNEPETELGIAAGEQRKIARLRLMKLLDTP
jgi:2-oxo-4-hydroxy-4-carboxy--5-ureidoimidazoline (OHCU) decarboxylase